MNHELIDRYVYAVTRSLPLKDREEVAREIESLISDMLEERCGAITPTDKDIRVVLAELGTPQEVVMQYSGEQNQALISGTYFLYYKRILKIVLPIVAVAIPFAVMLGFIFDGLPADPSEMFSTIFSGLIGGTIGGIIQAFAIITLVFAILERKQVVLDEDGELLMDLPTIPKVEEQIGPWEPILGILLSVLATTVFLLLPQLIGFWFGDQIGWIPVFATTVIRSLWLPIAIWLVCGIFKEAVKLIEGRYSMRVAFAILGANLVTFACALLVLLNQNILNPEFSLHIKAFLISEGLLVGSGGNFIADLLVQVNIVLLALLAFAMIIETVTAFVKALRSSTTIAQIE
ncbi:MAG: hypothetical protein FWE87_04335 [Coriobacteriia bacterium]|nr:hypothetical protein [Coriobacteriia bacterium]